MKVEEIAPNLEEPIEVIKNEPKNEETDLCVIKEKSKLVIVIPRLSEDHLEMLLSMGLSYFIESQPKLASKLGIKLTPHNSDNEDEDGRRRKEKRKNENSDDDDYQPDTFSALLNSNKRRKIAKEEKPPPVLVKPKLRRVEKKFVPVLEKLSLEELMETNTYHRFNKSVEHVLRSAEDIDVNELGKEMLSLSNEI